MLLLPIQIPFPTSYPNFSFKENLYSRKLAIKKNLAIQEVTHFRFVILVVILSTAKINFSLSSLSFVILVIPDCSALSFLFSHDFRYYDFPCIFLAQITQAT